MRAWSPVPSGPPAATLRPACPARDRGGTLRAMDERARALDAAHRAATRFLDSLPDRPVWPRADLDEMLGVFGGPLPQAGLAADDLVSRMAEDAEPGLVAIPGGRFFGFVIGGT